MFSGELIGIAKDILIVGGAVSVILLFFLLLRALICLIKISRFISSVRSSFEKMIAFTGLPLLIIQKIIQKIFIEKDDSSSSTKDTDSGKL